MYILGLGGEMVGRLVKRHSLSENWYQEGTAKETRPG